MAERIKLEKAIFFAGEGANSLIMDYKKVFKGFKIKVKKNYSLLGCAEMAKLIREIVLLNFENLS